MSLQGSRKSQFKIGLKMPKSESKGEIFVRYEFTENENTSLRDQIHNSSRGNTRSYFLDDK